MFSSLFTAVSGIQVAQAGLYVTGHNVSNNSTVGYVRQTTIQQTFRYRSAGTNGSGLMQIGLGSDIAAIRQIRDTFLDINYRNNVSKGSFYETKYAAGMEIQTAVFGEIEGAYKLQTVLNDVWDALEELHINPADISTRGNFLEICKEMIDKFDTAYKNLYDYQQDLNGKIKDQVARINTLVSEIDTYNQKISMNEATGDNANDYRDKRNMCLDELSSIISITYTERPNGHIEVITEGKDLLVGGRQSFIGLRYSAPNINFVEPIFSSSKEILRFDATDEGVKTLFNYNRNISDANGNDTGSLKALLLCRGLDQADYTSSPGQLDNTDPNYKRDLFNVTNCLIPKIQVQLDTLFNKIVTTINDAVAPYNATGQKDIANAPYDLTGEQSFLEVFTRTAKGYQDRFDASGNYVAEDPDNHYSLYTIGNIQVNPLLLVDGGTTYLSLYKTQLEEISDPNVVMDILNKWNSSFVGVDNQQKLNVNDFYDSIVVSLGIEIYEAGSFADNQKTLIIDMDNKRTSISGVSLDEEMTSMMKYQHAYNASARMINVIDSMIDKLVNGTGRVGL